MNNNPFGMPVINGVDPYPEPPYTKSHREFFIISYETDIDLLREVVPEPLEVTSNIVKYEFIRMHAYGLGDFTESGQVIPVKMNSKDGNYIHSMYLDSTTSILAGREIWGFPKRMAQPKLYANDEVLVGTLDSSTIRVAQATMALKHTPLELDEIEKAMSLPTFVLKNIPDVDGTPKISQLVEIQATDVEVYEAWTGPCSLELFQHALTNVAKLPIKKVGSAVYFRANVTVPYGSVAYDYLK
ncbi:acetoacetate decarboxylase [Francisella tularensis subsp. novicida]|uniref:acetoacetate decarboxylase n=1 Tax=Francisella tularensis TaxID=263 RepID=UPI000158ADBB|nr:acetoacetate decarboxylase [Francisella tularensis]AJI44840.1 acetoacetate decarboxylase [Francisella tularensis subsp. novicida F6168]AJJ47046.1 acetoacetate decarboxylase ADC [Francisella tularensis subsp. novicida]APC99527.1 acetoacetate decarboxylase [Francisella tularensis subsp. novicida]EDN35818.1 hypothetical protein FTCG_01661 [Francisella tularensis subsp. novicida GA99-3549]KFJ69565.1 acetoacetate decarboxylase [Francisella tularensis subsp. novicida]